MRILRSQYLQLQNKTNTTRRVSGYKQQVTSTPRPNPYTTTIKKTYNLRRKSIVGTSACYNDHGDNDYCNNIKMNQTMSRRKSTFTLFSRNASTSSTYTYDGIERRDSYSSTSSTTHSSGYETLNHTNEITQNHNTTMETTAEPEQMLERHQPMETTSTNEQCRHMRIRFLNIPEPTGDITVKVEYTNMSSQWLTNVYNSYEDELWEKIPRHPPTRKSKWHYNCLLCRKQLCLFLSLKTHLNNHLELYPYACRICTKQYTGRNSLVNHLRNKHGARKDYSNYMITYF